MPVVPMRTDGAWEKKKVPHAPNRDERGSQGRKKGKERGMGEEKRFPMPRIVIKEEAKEEKKEKSGAWEKKKVPHAPNRDKRGSQGREKGRERGMGEEKGFPCPES